MKLPRPYTKSDRWTYRYGRNGYERTEPLFLYWEVECDPISDDYVPNEISAEDLLRRWIERYPPKNNMHTTMYGPGMAAIHWFVEGSGTFEGAPFPDAVHTRRYHSDFLKHFTWPVHEKTGERLNFMRLPVVDKLWRTGRGDKGGFIQEATGWKPSPMQPCVYVPGLVLAAGIAAPIHWEPREREPYWKAARERNAEDGI